MRRIVLAALCAVTIALSVAPASADARLAARGMLTLTLKRPGMPLVSCTTVSLVQFNLTGSTFFHNESSPAGQSAGTPPVCAPMAVGQYTNLVPTVRQCTPVGGLQVPGSTLTISGSTYTIRSPYTRCAGGTVTDTITMTVSATSVAYRHDLIEPDGTEIRAFGTLARDA